MELVDYLRLARELTASTDIKELMLSAKYLQSEMEDKTPSIAPTSWINVRDIVDFIPHLKIQHPIKGAIQFVPWKYQEDTAKLLEENGKKMALVNMARQMGGSIIVCALALYRAVTRPNHSILVVGNTFSNACEILERIKFMVETCALPLPHMSVEGKGLINFNNGSRIIARAATKEAPRGLSISTLIVDEAAFIPWSKDQEFWQAVQPALAGTDSQTIMVSTPNKTRGIFYDLWSKDPSTIDAIQHTVIWSDNPTRDEAWADYYRTQLGAEKFAREHEGQFIDDQ